MSRRFFMMSEIMRWDTTETFVATCEAFAQIEGTKNCSIADVNDLQDLLIEKGFSISRLTPKPVSEEGWISVENEPKINDWIIIYVGDYPTLCSYKGNGNALDISLNEIWDFKDDHINKYFPVPPITNK